MNAPHKIFERRSHRSGERRQLERMLRKTAQAWNNCRRAGAISVQDELITGQDRRQKYWARRYLKLWSKAAWLSLS